MEQYLYENIDSKYVLTDKIENLVNFKSLYRVIEITEYNMLEKDIKVKNEEIERLNKKLKNRDEIINRYFKKLKYIKSSTIEEIYPQIIYLGSPKAFKVTKAFINSKGTWHVEIANGF